jgi:hypothetical protein
MSESLACTQPCETAPPTAPGVAWIAIRLRRGGDRERRDQREEAQGNGEGGIRTLEGAISPLLA